MIFENYAYQNPAVFYLPHDVHASDLKYKQMELKINSFIPAVMTDNQPPKTIAHYMTVKLIVSVALEL